jgi:mono/diheme cytochrome c family protein
MNHRTFRNRTRVNLIISGLFLFLWLWAIAGAFGSAEKKDWKDYQRDYEKKISQMGGKEVQESVLGVKLIEVAKLGVKDRCTTCHIAMGDLRMFGEENPLKPHPGGYLEQHPPERFGCTVCHGGLGEALGEEEAHSGTYRKADVAQVSCSKCHDAVTLEGAPELTLGKSLLVKSQCTNCHYARELSETEDFRPAPGLTGIGDKVGEKWLWRWLKEPKNYMPNAIMPRYEIDDKYVDALIGYLKDSKDPRLNPEYEYPEGDADRGKSILRLSFCISCHPFNGKGGKEAGDLGRIGNKVGEKWLVQMLANVHVFQPNTPMPQYNLSRQQISDVAAYLLDEFTDYDMLDEDEAKKLPSFWKDPGERSEMGRRIYKELRCANCHDPLQETGWWRKIGPEFSLVGDKPLSEINFGNSKVPRTRPDYLFEKIHNPGIYATPDNFMKMPKYDLPNDQIRDIVLSLLGFNANKVMLKEYQPPRRSVEDVSQGLISPPLFSSKETAEELNYPSTGRSRVYVPEGKFGRLVDKYRCFSCHAFKGRGRNMSYDLTVEGSRVRGRWLFNYLKQPYTIRPVLTIRMPIFNMTDEEASILTSSFMRKMFDPQIDKALEVELSAGMAVRGEQVLQEKGCLACHQMGKKGGYVGPSFTQGAYVGDKLRPGWILKWLKNPRAMKPDVLEPKYSLSDEEALAITAYLMSIKGQGKLSPKDGKQD